MGNGNASSIADVLNNIQNGTVTQLDALLAIQSGFPGLANLINQFTAGLIDLPTLQALAEFGDFQPPDQVTAPGEPDPVPDVPIGVLPDLPPDPIDTGPVVEDGQISPPVNPVLDAFLKAQAGTLSIRDVLNALQIGMPELAQLISVFLAGSLTLEKFEEKLIGTFGEDALLPRPLPEEPVIDPITGEPVDVIPGPTDEPVDEPTGDPRDVLARLLGSTLAGDVRFSESFVSTLNRGEVPRPGTDTRARDLFLLGPDQRGSFNALVGESSLPQFRFEQEQFAVPGVRGARRKTRGGIRF